MSTTKKSRGLKGILLGSFLADPKTARHLPFVLFVAFLALVSIASAHFADAKVHRISKLQKEMKEAKSAFISTRSELMQRSRATSIEERVAPLGLQISDEPAIEIKP